MPARISPRTAGTLSRSTALPQLRGYEDDKKFEEQGLGIVLHSHRYEHGQARLFRYFFLRRLHSARHQIRALLNFEDNT